MSLTDLTPWGLCDIVLCGICKIRKHHFLLISHPDLPAPTPCPTYHCQQNQCCEWLTCHWLQWFWSLQSWLKSMTKSFAFWVWEYEFVLVSAHPAVCNLGRKNDVYEGFPSWQGQAHSESLTHAGSGSLAVRILFTMDSGNLVRLFFFSFQSNSTISWHQIT